MKDTPFTRAAGKAHAHLMKGIDTAWERHGRAPLSFKEVQDNLSTRTATTDVSRMDGGNKLLEQAAKTKVEQMKRNLAGKPVDPGAISSSMNTSGSGDLGSAYESSDQI